MSESNPSVGFELEAFMMDEQPSASKRSRSGVEIRKLSRHICLVFERLGFLTSELAMIEGSRGIALWHDGHGFIYLSAKQSVEEASFQSIQILIIRVVASCHILSW